MENSQTARPQIVSLTHDNVPEQETSQKFTIKLTKLKLTLTIAVIFVLIITGAYLFLWPKAQTVRLASTARKSVSELFTDIDSVNTSLVNLFNFITESDQSDAKFSKLDSKDDQGDNIGARINNLLKNLGSVFKELEISKKGEVSFGGNVKGFTTPTNDPNKIYRDQRDLAIKVLSSIDDSKKTIEELEEKLSREGSPNHLGQMKQDINELKSEILEYLTETQKTASYYVLTSDLSIELEGNFDSFQLSLQSSNDVGDLANSFGTISKDLKKLKDTLEGVSNENLPSEIDSLHNDSIRLFAIVIDYFDHLKVLTLKEDSKGIVDLTNNTSVELNQLLLKGGDHELSFWKNNRVLNSYESISQKNTTLLRNLENEKNKNNLFIFNILGVK